MIQACLDKQVRRPGDHRKALDEDYQIEAIDGQ